MKKYFIFFIVLLLPILFGMEFLYETDDIILLDEISCEDTSESFTEQNSLIYKSGIIHKNKTFRVDEGILPSWVPIPPEENIPLTVPKYF